MPTQAGQEPSGISLPSRLRIGASSWSAESWEGVFYGAKVGTAARNKMKVTALHAAAAAQQLDIARMLVAHGADVNARQEEDFTPLHEAAATGQLKFAKLLLDHGADVNLRTA